jgi:creatinine amidohydrolase
MGREMSVENAIFDETMANLNWKQIAELADQKTITLLPCDPLEEHGPSMPIAVDIYLSYILTKKIKALLEKREREVVIAPPVYWGISNATGAFPGTFTIRKETLKALLFDILSCLRRWGFDHVFLVSMHGDPPHRNAIIEAIAEARIGTGIRCRQVVPYRRYMYSGYKGYENCILVESKDIEQVWEHYMQMQDIHAGSMEASFMARYFPNLIDLETTQKLAPTSLNAQDILKWQSGWAESREVIPEGYFGNPALIEMDKMEALLDMEAKSHAELIDSYLLGKYVHPPIK